MHYLHSEEVMGARMRPVALTPALTLTQKKQVTCEVVLNCSSCHYLLSEEFQARRLVQPPHPRPYYAYAEEAGKM